MEAAKTTIKVPAPVIKQLLTLINYTDARRKKKDIDFLVRHYVGASGGAKENCQYFQKVYRGASAHYFIDHDGTIWQSVKDEDIAWHCGAPSYKHKHCRNSNSIGIELCVKKDKNGNWYYTEATKKSAVCLFAYLMDKYDIPINHILRHYDVTGKICGEPDVRKGSNVWKDFKQELAAYLEQYRKGDVPKPEVKSSATLEKDNTDIKEPFLIETTCDSLFIRTGAGTNYRVAGAINEKAGHKKKYTIVEEKNGWGRLKSGAGWISLAYTKKAG